MPLLEAIGDIARVGAGIDLEAVRDAVPIEHLVQLAGVEPEAVLVAHVHRDAVVHAEIADVLVHEGERRIGRPLRQHVRPGGAILRGQVEIERRVLRVGGPGGRRGQLGAREEGERRGLLGRLHRLQRRVHLRVGGRGPSR